MSERIALDHLDRLKLDVHEQLGRSLLRAALLVVAGTMLLLAWVGLVAGALVFLSPRFDWEILLLAAGGLHLVIGLAFALAARSRAISPTGRITQ